MNKRITALSLISLIHCGTIISMEDSQTAVEPSQEHIEIHNSYTVERVDKLIIEKPAAYTYNNEAGYEREVRRSNMTTSQKTLDSLSEGGRRAVEQILPAITQILITYSLNQFFTWLTISSQAQQKNINPEDQKLLENSNSIEMQEAIRQRLERQHDALLEAKKALQEVQNSSGSYSEAELRQQCNELNKQDAKILKALYELTQQQSDAVLEFAALAKQKVQ